MHPGLTGINVVAVRVPLRSLASGFTVCITNLLGCFMGPLLPGVVMDNLKGVLGMHPDTVEDDRVRLMCYGMATVFSGTVLSLFSATAARSALSSSPEYSAVADDSARQ